MKFNNKVLFINIILAIIIISFSFYSSVFYPLLNSDDALNILIAQYYKLPNDLYCWGQDRGGTLIPLMSQFFIKLFKVRAIISVSISNYLILIIGFLSLSSLLKNNYSKILLAIVWFLPFQRFIDLLRFPIGVEYSIIALAIFIISKINAKDINLKFKNNIFLLLLILVFTISIWVSDLSIVTILNLFFILILFGFIKNKKIEINKIYIYYFAIGLLASISIINYFKNFALTKSNNYLSINNFNQVKESLSIIKTEFFKVLAFQSNETIVSFYSYLVLLFIISFSAFILKRKLIKNLLSSKWFLFFIFDFAVVFSTIILSTWVLKNGMGRWYFVASYISFSLAVIFAIDNLNDIKQIKIFKTFVFATAIIGAISPIYCMKFYSPKTLKPMSKLVGEFKQLGKIGLISEFWNSYISSCPNPDLIVATPHDKDNVRYQPLVDSVFAQKNIYVIKDMWFDNFPDTLEQFGYVLLKEGKPFSIAGCDVCKYNKTKLFNLFQLNKIKHDNLNTAFDDSLNKNFIYLTSNCKNKINTNIIETNELPIGIGSFTVKFYLKASNFLNKNPIAKLEVLADNGNIKLSEKQISQTNFTNKKFNILELKFNTTKRYSSIKFNVVYLGNADLYFEKIELLEN